MLHDDGERERGEDEDNERSVGQCVLRCAKQRRGGDERAEQGGARHGVGGDRLLHPKLYKSSAAWDPTLPRWGVPLFRPPPSFHLLLSHEY